MYVLCNFDERLANTFLKDCSAALMHIVSSNFTNVDRYQYNH